MVDTGTGDWFVEARSYHKKVLRNRNYFLRFRFRLLSSYGSGSNSDFLLVTGTVQAPYLDQKKHSF
jgi:hypothetical protein